MIKKNSNGMLIAELGNGTLYTALVFYEGVPCGLAFTNNKDGTLDEESIVLQITSSNALASYMDLTMRYLKELMKTSDGGSSEVDSMLKGIEEFQDSIKHMMPNNNME